MTKKRCIFHMPNYIDLDAKSGSSVHPLKMIEGFEENGYLVDCVIGYGKSRAEKIHDIKKNIENGEKYEFLFSESSTMPTLLTEKDHLPMFPDLDFGFLKYCKKNNIRIGLFYADVQWKFDFYRESVPWYKRCVSYPMYRYDLIKYRSLIDIFYMPTMKMGEYLREEKELLRKAKPLMPGSCYDKDFIEKKVAKLKERDGKSIHIFYVGGVSKIYDLTTFFKGIKPLEQVRATICCRKEEWEEVKIKYAQDLTNRVLIVHESGKALEKYYQSADVCCAFLGKGKYMSMAMPVKIFEYLAHVTPILATKGTEAGSFVKEQDVGWEIECKHQALTICLENILNNPQDLIDKCENELKILEKSTWKARASQVAKELRRR